MDPVTAAVAVFEQKLHREGNYIHFEELFKGLLLTCRPSVRKHFSSYSVSQQLKFFRCRPELYELDEGYVSSKKFLDLFDGSVTEPSKSSDKLSSKINLKLSSVVSFLLKYYDSFHYLKLKRIIFYVFEDIAVCLYYLTPIEHYEIFRRLPNVVFDQSSMFLSAAKGCDATTKHISKDDKFVLLVVTILMSCGNMHFERLAEAVLVLAHEEFNSVLESRPVSWLFKYFKRFHRNFNISSEGCVELYEDFNSAPNEYDLSIANIDTYLSSKKSLPSVKGASISGNEKRSYTESFAAQEISEFLHKVRRSTLENKDVKKELSLSDRTGNSHEECSSTGTHHSGDVLYDRFCIAVSLLLNSFRYLHYAELATCVPYLLEDIVILKDLSVPEQKEFFKKIPGTEMDPKGTLSLEEFCNQGRIPVVTNDEIFLLFTAFYVGIFGSTHYRKLLKKFITSFPPRISDFVRSKSNSKQLNYLKQFLKHLKMDDNGTVTLRISIVHPSYEQEFGNIALLNSFREGKFTSDCLDDIEELYDFECIDSEPGIFENIKESDGAAENEDAIGIAMCLRVRHSIAFLLKYFEVKSTPLFWRMILLIVSGIKVYFLLLSLQKQIEFITKVYQPFLINRSGIIFHKSSDCVNKGNLIERKKKLFYFSYLLTTHEKMHYLKLFDDFQERAEGNVDFKRSNSDKFRYFQQFDCVFSISDDGYVELLPLPEIQLNSQDFDKIHACDKKDILSYFMDSSNESTKEVSVAGTDGSENKIMNECGELLLSKSISGKDAHSSIRILISPAHNFSSSTNSGSIEWNPIFKNNVFGQLKHIEHYESNSEPFVFGSLNKSGDSESEGKLLEPELCERTTEPQAASGNLKALCQDVVTSSSDAVPESKFDSTNCSSLGIADRNCSDINTVTACDAAETVQQIELASSGEESRESCTVTTSTESETALRTELNPCVDANSESCGRDEHNKILGPDTASCKVATKSSKDICAAAKFKVKGNDDRNFSDINTVTACDAAETVQQIELVSSRDESRESCTVTISTESETELRTELNPCVDANSESCGRDEHNKILEPDTASCKVATKSSKDICAATKFKVKGNEDCARSAKFKSKVIQKKELEDEISKKIAHSIVYLLRYFTVESTEELFCVILHVFSNVKAYFFNLPIAEQASFIRKSYFLFSIEDNGNISLNDRDVDDVNIILNDQEKQLLFFSYALCKTGKMHFLKLFGDFAKQVRSASVSKLSREEKFRYFRKVGNILSIDANEEVDLLPLPKLQFKSTFFSNMYSDDNFFLNETSKASKRTKSKVKNQKNKVSPEGTSVSKTAHDVEVSKFGERTTDCERNSASNIKTSAINEADNPMDTDEFLFQNRRESFKIKDRECKEKPALYTDESRLHMETEIGNLLLSERERIECTEALEINQISNHPLETIDIATDENPSVSCANHTILREPRVLKCDSNLNNSLPIQIPKKTLFVEKQWTVTEKVQYAIYYLIQHFKVGAKSPFLEVIFHVLNITEDYFNMPIHSRLNLLRQCVAPFCVNDMNMLYLNPSKTCEEIRLNENERNWLFIAFLLSETGEMHFNDVFDKFVECNMDLPKHTLTDADKFFYFVMLDNLFNITEDGILQLSDLPTLNVDLTPLLYSFDLVNCTASTNTIVSKEDMGNDSPQPSNDFQLCSRPTWQTSVFHKTVDVTSLTKADSTTEVTSIPTANGQQNALVALCYEFNSGSNSIVEKSNVFENDKPNSYALENNIPNSTSSHLQPRSFKERLKKSDPSLTCKVKVLNQIKSINFLIQNSEVVHSKPVEAPIATTAEKAPSTSSNITKTSYSRTSNKVGAKLSIKQRLDTKTRPLQADGAQIQVFVDLRAAIGYLLNIVEVPIDMNIVGVALHALPDIQSQFNELSVSSRNNVIQKIFEYFSDNCTIDMSVQFHRRKREKELLFIIYILSISPKKMHFLKILKTFSKFDKILPPHIVNDSDAFKYFRAFTHHVRIRIGNDGYVMLTSFPPSELKSINLAQIKRPSVCGGVEQCSGGTVPQKVRGCAESISNNQSNDNSVWKKQSSAESRNPNEMRCSSGNKAADTVLEKTALSEVCKRITHGIVYLLNYFDPIHKYDSISMVMYVLSDVKDFFLSSPSVRRRHIMNICSFCFQSNDENMITKLDKSPPLSILNDEERDVLFIVYLLYEKSMSYRELFAKFNEYNRRVPDSALSLEDQRKYISERKNFFVLKENGFVKLHPLPVIEECDGAVASSIKPGTREFEDQKRLMNLSAKAFIKEDSRVCHSNSNSIYQFHRSRKRSKSKTSKTKHPLTNFFDPGTATESRRARNTSKETVASRGKPSVPPGFNKFEPSVQSHLKEGDYKQYYENVVDVLLSKTESNETLNCPSPKRPNSNFVGADSSSNSELEVQLSVDRFYDYSSHKDPAMEIEAVNFFTFFLSMYRAGVYPDMLLTHLQSASADIQSYLKNCYHGDILSFFLSHPKLFYISPSGNVYLKWLQR